MKSAGKKAAAKSPAKKRSGKRKGIKVAERESKGKQAKKARKPARSLGSVPNLEEYVQPDWWRRIFNSLYVKTDGDVVEDGSITKTEVTVFSEILQLQPETRILDVCCGQGRHSLELARRGFESLEGLDRSRYLVQKARARAVKEGLAVRFREGTRASSPIKPTLSTW